MLHINHHVLYLTKLKHSSHFNNVIQDSLLVSRSPIPSLIFAAQLPVNAINKDVYVLVVRIFHAEAKLSVQPPPTYKEAPCVASNILLEHLHRYSLKSSIPSLWNTRVHSIFVLIEDWKSAQKLTSMYYFRLMRSDIAKIYLTTTYDIGGMTRQSISLKAEALYFLPKFVMWYFLSII